MEAQVPPELLTGKSRGAHVKALFESIAGHYDRVNDLMTAGQHRSWKRELVRLLGIEPGDRCLDLCTGTGDLAFLVKARAGESGQVTALDFSPEMMARARSRTGSDAISWLEGDALALPFDEASFDHVSVGFGLRNVSSIEGALAEMWRVLRPGGTAASLDMAKPSLPVLKPIIRAYEFAIVPRLAELAGAPGQPYRYLPRSNVAFPDRAGLERLFKEAGFIEVRAHEKAFGAVAIVTGTKPPAPVSA